MSLLVEVMKRLGEVESLREALERYVKCLDSDFILPVPNMEVYVGDNDGGIICSKDNCAVITSRVLVVLPDGRVASKRAWPWLTTTRELDMVFECVERLKDEIKDMIRKLDEKIEEMKTLLAEAKLLCS
jgi:hypothetical protein